MIRWNVMVWPTKNGQQSLLTAMFLSPQVCSMTAHSTKSCLIAMQMVINRKSWASVSLRRPGQIICVSVSGRWGKLSTDQVASCTIINSNWCPFETSILLQIFPELSDVCPHWFTAISRWGNWGMWSQWNFPRHNSKFISDLYIIWLCSW